MQKEGELKAKALKTSIKEGGAAAAASSLGDNYITPYALALGAQPVHIGFLSSFSGLTYYLSQFFGAKMLEKYPRKNIVTKFVLFNAIMWLIIASLGIFLFKSVDGSLIYILILSYSLLMFLSGIAYPAWFSWMGDLAPEKERGKYFSKRNRVINISGLVVVFASAFLLDLFKTKGYVLIGFSVLFALAFCFRFISYLLLKRQYSPKFKQKKEDYFSIFAFLKKYDNFGKFALYQGLFNFAIMIASPFFAVYMLKELGYSYSLYITVSISLTIFLILALPLMGKISDKYGNRILLVLANILFVCTPILWIISSNPIWLIFVPQLSAGVANAALIISFTNFTYDAVSPKHRAICVTYTNILIGLGIFFGSMAGGFIVDYLHPASISPYIFVFFVATALRFLVAAIFLPQIKEVRKVKKMPSTYALMHYPLHRLNVEVHRFARIPRKVFGKFI